MAAAAAAADHKEYLQGSRPARVPLSGMELAHRLHRRGRWLEVATTVWNVGEVAVTLTLGFLAHSLALVAFGLDSFIEVFASLVVLWHLDQPTLVHRSRRALTLVAGAFLILGLYLLAAGTDGLLSHVHPEQSVAGMSFLGATVAVMAVLAGAKRRTGIAAGSEPLVANATMTLLDGILASAVLIALALDAAGGWWWADPGAAILVSGLALREGIEGLRGRGDIFLG